MSPIFYLSVTNLFTLSAVCLQISALCLHSSRDRYDRTPLHLVASNGNEPILWQLLSHGADVHAKDNDGATALHRAIDAGHDDVARMILDRGCSLDVADVDGETALHIAVRRENNEILAILLRKGTVFENHPKCRI